jgi:hypothetical protein
MRAIILAALVFTLAGCAERAEAPATSGAAPVPTVEVRGRDPEKAPLQRGWADRLTVRREPRADAGPADAATID